jgi:hypothetical protein
MTHQKQQVTSNNIQNGTSNEKRNMSTNMLFGLPSDILSSIYEYDNTYKKIFSDNVVKMIWGKALLKNLKSFTLEKESFFGGSDDAYDSDGEMTSEIELDMERGTDTVKFAAGYMFRNMGFYDNYVMSKCHYGIGNNFCINDLSAVCIQLHDYVYDESSVENNKFTKRSYIAVRLYIKNILIFDGGVYNDILESDCDENDNIMVVHYNNEKRMALFQYIV